MVQLFLLAEPQPCFSSAQAPQKNEDANFGLQDASQLRVEPSRAQIWNQPGQPITWKESERLFGIPKFQSSYATLPALVSFIASEDHLFNKKIKSRWPEGL
jgi:hypothetical protein